MYSLAGPRLLQLHLHQLNRLRPAIPQRPREALFLNRKVSRLQRQCLLGDAGHCCCQQPAAHDDADAGAALGGCGDGLAGLQNQPPRAHPWIVGDLHVLGAASRAEIAAPWGLARRSSTTMIWKGPWPLLITLCTRGAPLTGL
jgi:hypothetical protein